MAAISNTVEWKQAAMQKAERLTDMWDIVKAWAGRAAEIVLSLCMFAQLIGILPGVHYPDLVSNCILGVQMIMLDFGAFALSPLAEHARNAGQEDAAKKADDMSRFLIGLVIATVVIVSVGQFAPLFGAGAWLVTGIVKYSEPVLILARIVCVVKYIHVIHSLRSNVTALAIQPTPQPAQALDYQEIARHLQPLLPSTIAPDVSGLTEQLLQLRATVDELATKSAPEIAPESTLSSEDVSDESTPETLTDARQEERDQERNNITLMSDRRSAQPRTTKRTGNRSEKASKAASIIKRNPQISAPDLAKKAQISTSYARKLLVNQ